MGIIRDILSYWFSQILKATFFAILIIIVVIAVFYAGNPQGRYFSDWDQYSYQGE